MANYEMIDNEIKEFIQNYFSKNGSNILFKEFLRNSECALWHEIISINNDEAFQSFVEFWENGLGLSSFRNTLQAKCAYKIFFM